MPGAYGNILRRLALLTVAAGHRTMWKAYIEHHVPQLDRAVSRHRCELIFVRLGPCDVVEPVWCFVAGDVAVRNQRASVRGKRCTIYRRLVRVCRWGWDQGTRCGGDHCPPNRSWQRKRWQGGWCGKASERPGVESTAGGAGAIMTVRGEMLLVPDGQRQQARRWPSSVAAGGTHCRRHLERV